MNAGGDNRQGTLADALRRRGLARLPFTGEPPPSSLTAAFATRVSECLRDLRAGKVGTVLIHGSSQTGHRRILAALLERFARDGHMSAWFDTYPDSELAMLHGLLRQWGLEMEEGAADELKALLELFVGHQAAKGQFAYLCLPAEAAPPEAVQPLLRWLAGLRHEGRFTVRFLLLGTAGEEPPGYLTGVGPDGTGARGFQRFPVPVLLPSEVEHYIHARLRLAGADDPQAVIGMELCRLVAAYAEGQVPVVDRLMLGVLEHAVLDASVEVLRVRQRHVEVAAAAQGLELRTESVTAEGGAADADPTGETPLAMLVFSSGDEKSQQVELRAPRMVMGRDGDCDIPLDSRFISRFQCLFMNTRRGWYVLDLGSTNGTFVNGRRVREHLLRHGDVVSLGRHHIRFVQPGTAEESDAPEYLSTEMLVLPEERSNVSPEVTLIGKRGATPA